MTTEPIQVEIVASNSPSGVPDQKQLIGKVPKIPAPSKEPDSASVDPPKESPVTPTASADTKRKEKRHSKSTSEKKADEFPANVTEVSVESTKSLFAVRENGQKSTNPVIVGTYRADNEGGLFLEDTSVANTRWLHIPQVGKIVYSSADDIRAYFDKNQTENLPNTWCCGSCREQSTEKMDLLYVTGKKVRKNNCKMAAVAVFVVIAVIGTLITLFVLRHEKKL